MLNLRPATYIFSFKGLYPIGAYLAVVSTTVEVAWDHAYKHLQDRGFDPETLQLEKLMDSFDMNKPYIIADGDY